MPPKLEDIIQLLTKKVDGLCTQFTAIKNDIQGLRGEIKNLGETLTEKLRAEMNNMETKFEAEINSVTLRADELETNVNASFHHAEETHKEEMDALKKTFKKQTDEMREISDGQDREIVRLQEMAEEQEQYSRRNAIRILGIPESKDEKCEQLALEIFNVKMGLSIRQDMIDRAHRVGRPVAHNAMDTGGKTVNKRPIILKFTSYRYKRLVMQKKRELKGKKVMVVEDLTRYRAILVKKALNNPRVSATWTSDGRVLVKRKDNDRILHIKCARDLPATV